MKQQPNSNFRSEAKKIIFSDTISLQQRRHYGFLYKIFCCKCFHCCQNVDFSLFTSKHRKGAFQRMVKKYLKDTHSFSKSKTNVIMDPFFILVALLLGQESQIYAQLLEQVGNKNQKTIFSKQDLQFYVLQLCTYLVFHEEMSNIELSTLLQRACRIDLHFSLRYYCFMKSLQIIDSNIQIKKLPLVEKHNIDFRNRINNYHKIKQTPKKESRKTKQTIQNKLDTNLTEQVKQEQFQFTRQNFRSSLEGQKQQDNKNLSKSQKSNSITSSKSSDLDLDMEQEMELSKSACRKYNSEIQSALQPSMKLTSLYLEELYESVFIQKKQKSSSGLFQSTINFFTDLVTLSQLLIKVQSNRNEVFENYLQKINQKLPALVYIPFTKNEYQQLNVLKVIIKQSKVFRTKERAPFKLCFQAYFNPNISEQSNKQKKIKSTSSINRKNSSLKRSTLFEQDILLEIDGEPEIQAPNRKNSQQQSQSCFYEQKLHKSRLSDKQQKIQHDKQLTQSQSSAPDSNPNSRIDLKNIKKNIWDKIFQLKNKAKQLINQKQKTNRSQKSHHSVKDQESSIANDVLQSEQSQNVSEFSEKFNNSQKIEKEQKILQSRVYDKKQKFYEEQDLKGLQQKLFGQSYSQICEQISLKSLYSKLRGYKIMNIMIKSNDDLRQQCFAMQLLQQFDRIFKMQRLKIKLYPYEVLPLSYNSGIIQFIHQAITIDELIKRNGSLKFVCKNKQMMNNFIYSLAGYSLVTYFLQVKDRHNANIMIKKDGTIIHIDYGFFLSSMPGKGVQLEKNVPFKLTNQYIDVLGGVKSKQFQYFRKIFYQGFNSLRKHQHRILILTKLMYSSYGTTMRCFEKGDEAIQKFVSRFNPKNIRTDGELSLFCQNLINSSIQNWRAKWYDRWQYFAQGILY